MIDSIQAFGDSFLFGCELLDCDKGRTGHGEHSELTWPALVAKQLNLKYACWAESGRGNQSIAFKVFQYASKNSLNIINWTWIDRFDHHFQWCGWPETIRPTDDKLSNLYYKNLHTEFDDKVRNLITITATLHYLKNNNFPFIMTYMDHLIIDNAEGIKNLRNEVVDSLQTFPDNQTFLEWSRSKGYPESEGWHPLEQAHEAAAEYWQPIYENVINTHITTTKD